MLIRKKPLSIQHAYLDMGVIFGQTPVHVYPRNGRALYSWQGHQHMYCLPWRFARDQLLDALELMLAELVHRASLYLHGQTGDLPPLIYDSDVQDARLYRTHEAVV